MDSITDKLAEFFVDIMSGLFMLAIAGGWIANIVKIAMSAADPITGMFVLRVVGIFVFPIGVILGYV